LEPHEPAWRQVARSLGGEYTSGDFFHRDTLRVPVPPWQLLVEIEPTSLIPLTRLRASCTVRRAFFLHLERTNQGTVLATSHLIFAESVLALPGYREALLSERFTLQLEPHQLICDTYGVVTEYGRLIQLIEVVAETLQRLHEFQLVLD
jgi:hypothetical protein